MGNILIAGECSGALRRRFRAAGHNAWSCDLKIAEDGGNYHIQGNMMLAISERGPGYWDLIILHPDCTALCVAGNQKYAAGKPDHWKRQDAIVWTERLWLLAQTCGKRVILENPIGVLGTKSNLGKAQWLQPYEFGDDASKATGLWLHNVPRIPKDPAKRFPGRIVEWNGKLVERWENQTDSGQNRLSPGPQRATDRARTYPGIADAIVAHCGALL